MAEDHNILCGEFAIDAWLVLRSKLTPEQFIDLELQRVKKELLEAFYQRFPGQRPTGDEHAEG